MSTKTTGPLQREEIHLRRIEVRAFRRADGRYDVEARLVDTKTASFDCPAAPTVPAGEPVHDIGVRLVVDEDLTVHEAVGFTAGAPFGACPEAGAALASLAGLRIGAGWQRAVRERLGGVRGCTHMVELLGPAATTAYQALAPVRLARPDERDARGRPTKIDSCHAYASHGDVVRLRWPAFYDGPKAG